MQWLADAGVRVGIGVGAGPVAEQRKTTILGARETILPDVGVVAPVHVPGMVSRLKAKVFRESGNGMVCRTVSVSMARVKSAGKPGFPRQRSQRRGRKGL